MNNSDRQSHLDSLVPDRVPREKLKEWIGEDQHTEDCYEGQNLLNAIRDELGDKIGPRTEGDVPGAYNVSYSRYLEFYPRKQHLKNLKAEIARLGA